MAVRAGEVRLRRTGHGRAALRGDLSQVAGSEFPALALHHYMLLQRNLIYMGTMSGKESVVPGWAEEAGRGDRRAQPPAAGAVFADHSRKLIFRMRPPVPTSHPASGLAKATAQ
jgi:hypothetical protein